MTTPDIDLTQIDADLDEIRAHIGHGGPAPCPSAVKALAIAETLRAAYGEAFQRGKLAGAEALFQQLAADVINHAVAERTGKDIRPGEQLYLVWSHQHNAWWRPNGHGYTRDVWSAGRYSLVDAERCASGIEVLDDGRPHEVVIAAPPVDTPAPGLTELLCRRIDGATRAKIAAREAAAKASEA